MPISSNPPQLTKPLTSIRFSSSLHTRSTLKTEGEQTNLSASLFVEVHDEVRSRLFRDVIDCVDFVQTFVDN